MPRSANARVFIETAILVGTLLLLTAVVPGLAHQPKPEVSESDEKSDKKQHKQTPKYERATDPSLYLGSETCKTCHEDMPSKESVRDRAHRPLPRPLEVAAGLVASFPATGFDAPGVHFEFPETSENASIGLSKPASIETALAFFTEIDIPGGTWSCRCALSCCREEIPFHC
jgi:hypothetical protein